MTTTAKQSTAENGLIIELDDSAKGAKMHSVEDVIGLMQNKPPPDAPWLWRDRWAD